MPIVSRQLESVQQSGGTVLASFLAVDSKAREWRRSRSRFADEAAATVASNAHNWTPQLIISELEDFEQHILDGGTVGSFTWADQTQTQGFRRFLRFFASTDDLDRAGAIAPIILTFTKAQIKNNAGITNAQAQFILDRANDLVAMVAEQTDAISNQQDLVE